MEEVIKGIFIFILMLFFVSIIISFPTMWLWNWLMTSIFNLREINFFEALGLVALSQFLFGSFHKTNKE